MKKIIISLSTIALVASVGFAATRAYFTSTATSTGNTFTAGTLVMGVNTGADDHSTAHTLFNVPAMAPGDVTGPQTLHFVNSGSVSGKVGIVISYAGAGTDSFAKNLMITDASMVEPNSVTVTSVQTDWAQHIINYPAADGGYNGDETAAINDGAIIKVGTVNYPTVYGMYKVEEYFDNGSGTPLEWTANATGSVTMNMQLNPLAGNSVQGLSMDVTLTAHMVQFSDPVAEYADPVNF